MRLSTIAEIYAYGIQCPVDRHHIQIYAQRQIICIDYDDTLVDGPYEYGKLGHLDSEAVKVAKWIISKGISLIVLTARPQTDWNKIKVQLHKAGVEVNSVTNQKPPALAYLDNRSVPWENSAGKAIAWIKKLMRQL